MVVVVGDAAGGVVGNVNQGTAQFAICHCLPLPPIAQTTRSAVAGLLLEHHVDA